MRHRGRFLGTRDSTLISPVSQHLTVFFIRYTWVMAVESAGPSSTEALSYNAQAGYYRIIVNSYSGTGSYKLIVSK